MSVHGNHSGFQAPAIPVSTRKIATVTAVVTTVSRNPQRMAAASWTKRKKRKNGLVGPLLTNVSVATHRMSMP